MGSAYTTLVADTLARFKRMQGYDVAFLTGTMNTVKISLAPRPKPESARANTWTAIPLVFRKLWNELGIGYTFHPHYFARALARRASLPATRWDAGYIYKGFYQGRYCV